MHGGACGVPTCILCCFNVAMHAERGYPTHEPTVSTCAQVGSGWPQPGHMIPGNTACLSHGISEFTEVAYRMSMWSYFDLHKIPARCSMEYMIITR